MTSKETPNYQLSLSFENVSMPPFEDILIITYKSPYGKIGVSGSLNLLQPDRFEIVEVDDEIIEALLVNKRILKRIPVTKLLDILRQKVFPYIEKGEIVKVDFKLKIVYETVDINLAAVNES